MGCLTPFFVLFLFVVFIIIFVVPPLFVKRRYIKKVPYNDLGSPTTRGSEQSCERNRFFCLAFCHWPPTTIQVSTSEVVAPPESNASF